jgi:deoxycytidine triphosphate deaminase
MILSQQTIQAEINAGNIVITPFNLNQLNRNSYDLRVGNWFYYVRLLGGERVYFGPKFFANGEILPLPTGVGFLAMSNEWVSTSNNIVCKMQARSTVGRSFFSVCNDAGLGDIGYANHWTMEIINYLHGTSSLVVGEKIAQLIFYRTTEEPAYVGQYQIKFPECMLPAAYRNKAQLWNEETEKLWKMSIQSS